MNYYPNSYLNYPYGSNGMMAQQPYMQSMQNQPMTQSPQYQLPQSYLNGKIVDSADIVKATEVPIGSYGVFPKADLSEIYIKTWNNNGTTNILTFKPIITDNTTQQEDISISDLSNKIMDKIKGLENKLDNIINNNVKEEKKKEVNLNAY
jgi:hypothetical protein